MRKTISPSFFKPGKKTEKILDRINIFKRMKKKNYDCHSNNLDNCNSYPDNFSRMPSIPYHTFSTKPNQKMNNHTKKKITNFCFKSIRKWQHKMFYSWTRLLEYRSCVTCQNQRYTPTGPIKTITIFLIYILGIPSNCGFTVKYCIKVVNLIHFFFSLSLSS